MAWDLNPDTTLLNALQNRTLLQEAIDRETTVEGLIELLKMAVDRLAEAREKADEQGLIAAAYGQTIRDLISSGDVDRDKARAVYDRNKAALSSK